MNHRILCFIFCFSFLSNAKAAWLGDGVDDQLYCQGSSIETNTSFFSITAWIKVDQDRTGTYTILTRNNGTATSAPYTMRLETTASSQLALVCENQDAESVLHSTPADCSVMPCVASGEWYFVACTFDEAKLRPWVNAIQGTIANGVSLSSPEGEVYIGNNPVSNSYFPGFISDVSIYTRNLEQKNLQLLYLSRMHGNVAPTFWASDQKRVAYWPIDDATNGQVIGTTATFQDRSGNGNSCTGLTATTGGTGYADFLRYQ